MGVLGITDPAGNGQVLGKAALSYDVKRKFAWRMIIDTNTLGIGDQESQMLTIQCRKAARPKYEFAEYEMKWGNEKWRIAGRLNINDIEVEFYDAIPLPDGGEGERESVNPIGSNLSKSTALIMYQWYNKMYDPITGNMSMSGSYKTKAVLELFEPGGEVIEQWLFTGMFPKSINYNDVDMDSDDPVNVTVTFAYDKCFRLAEAAVGAVPAIPDTNPSTEIGA